MSGNSDATPALQAVMHRGGRDLSFAKPALYCRFRVQGLVFVSLPEGDPNIDPKYYNPYDGDPQKGMPNFFKLPYIALAVASLDFLTIGRA